MTKLPRIARSSRPATAFSEATLLDALESLGEGVILWDTEDRFVFCNGRYQEILPEFAALLEPGAKLEDGLRRAVGLGIYADTAGREEQWIAERMAAHRAIGGAYEIEMTDGRWLRVNERRTREGGTVTIVDDVSEIKAREQALMAAKEAAERASRSKSELLANMSHELRTPLNAIIGFSDILKNQMYGPLGDPKYGDYARDINESGVHLLALINDILDLSKIEAGKFELRPSRIVVEHCVEVAVKMVRVRADEKGVSVAAKLGEPLPALWADERAIKQILSNLLSNAVKFTPAGGSVMLAADLLDGAHRLVVSDTGIGIPGELLAEVTKPFFQVDSALDRAHQGTGLGLALCQSLIDLHGGQLTIRSTLSQGTEVSLVFPKARVVTTPG